MYKFLRQMKNIKFYKIIILIVFAFTIIIIGVLTYGAISETEGWKWFAIDYNTKDHIISAYGTLIGGVLAFLSILFVLFQILEQRQQIIDEKLESERELKKALLDKTILTKLYIKSLLRDIKSCNSQLDKFIIREREFPTMMNKLQYNTNRTFLNILTIDDFDIFKGFRLHLSKFPEWRTYYLALLGSVNFYDEMFKTIKANMKSHLNFKETKHNFVSEALLNLMNSSNHLMDNYRKEDINFESNELYRVLNEFVVLYYKYLDECERKDEIQSLRTISDEILKPFIEELYDIRKSQRFKDLGTISILQKSSDIRKHIKQIDYRGKQFANELEKVKKDNFIDDCDSVNQLKLIKSKIEEIKSPKK